MDNDTFTSYLDKESHQLAEADIISLMLHYLKSRLGDVKISILEHLMQPACYRELNISESETQFKDLLITYAEKNINNIPDLPLIGNYYVFALQDLQEQVQYVFGFTPSDRIDFNRLSFFYAEAKIIWQLINHVLAKNSEEAARRMAAIVGRLTHDMSALASLSAAVSENDTTLKDKIQYAYRLSRAVTLYLGDLNLQKVNIPAKELIESIISSFPAKEKMKINLSFKDKYGFISADIEYIEQALQAIVENAIRAIQFAGNEIKINIKRQRNRSIFNTEDWLEIEVSDNGAGIPAEYLTEVRKPLFTTWKEEGHVGLGLSQAEKVIRAHGGSLEIDSHFPGGTKTTIYLPLKDVKDQK